MADASLVTIFGGSGFLGRSIVRTLLAAGWRVRVASRSPKPHTQQQEATETVAIDWNSPEQIKAAMAGAQAVVNLVGSFQNMQAVNHTLAATLANAAREAGIAQFVHLSALGVQEGQALYAQSKAAGEAAVRAAVPHATVLRPSVVFGAHDDFTNRFAALIRVLPLVPVVRAAAKFQPISVEDVAAAVRVALEMPHTQGQSYDLGGPNVFSMMELQEKIAQAMGRKRPFLAVPDALCAPMIRATGWLPGAPINWDQWLMLQADNIVREGAQGIASLNIVPQALEELAPQWLMR
jgi:uncharacterized protein YbjT (DUF2867 family)